MFTRCRSIGFSLLSLLPFLSFRFSLPFAFHFEKHFKHTGNGWTSLLLLRFLRLWHRHVRMHPRAEIQRDGTGNTCGIIYLRDNIISTMLNPILRRGENEWIAQLEAGIERDDVPSTIRSDSWQVVCSPRGGGEKRKEGSLWHICLLSPSLFRSRQ